MAKSIQATWGGRFSAGPAELMLRFSESVSFDRRLAPFDICGSKAHSAMLAAVGLITEKERAAIHKGLDAIACEIAAGAFKWDTALEDVHMNIEHELTKRVPAATKLHTARSRNDQVATDMRLYFKHACVEIAGALKGVKRALVDLADANRAILIPGYTHMQRAQPVSAAHHLLAYVEMFARDAARFATVADHANWCPLGSGAIAGTTLPIDRGMTAKLLGFVDAKGRPRVTTNSMDAVSDRDVHIEFAAACAITAVHFSRLAEDLILWSTAEFRFVDLPDAFCTGSSLMPQKKNFDAAELLRGKSGRMHGNLTSLLTMVKGLPLTYNRDMQEDKPPVFDSHDQTVLCAEVVTAALAGARFREERCAVAVADPLLLATDAADYLVARGVPFREAHHAVGVLVKEAEIAGVPLPELPIEKVQGVHKAFAADWTQCFDLARAMQMRERTGMPGPRQVAREIARWRKALADHTG